MGRPRRNRATAILDPAHPYAQDLDLFGKGSLFELLSTARTHIGEDTLARWLLAPAEPATLRERNQAVDELRPRMDLREDLAVLAEEARTGVDPSALAAWGEAPRDARPQRSGSWTVGRSRRSGVAALAAMLMSAAGLGASRARARRTWRSRSRYVFLLGLLANGFYLQRRGKAIDAVVAAVDRGRASARADRGGAGAAGAGAVPIAAAGPAARRRSTPRASRLRSGWRGCERLAERLDSRDNLFVRMLEIFILWTPRHAAEVEDWRRHSGPAVRRWLEAVGRDRSAELARQPRLRASGRHRSPSSPTTAPCLEAEAIGHPLIPEDRVVRNDVRLGRRAAGAGGQRLQHVGQEHHAAHAGHECRCWRRRARRCARGGCGFRRLAVGASIRLNDSLQGGVSRFYAEILRLRQILDLTPATLPVLFLIDEFLHGTNSHDRRIGAQALVRGLVERGAIGLITTHDLALADIADALGERAANVHFEDHIEDGQIRFDYHMRPGRGAEEQRHRADAVGGAGDLTADGNSRTGAGVRLRAGRRGARRAGRRIAPATTSGWRRGTPARWAT